jgi:hypothetical protein
MMQNSPRKSRGSGTDTDPLLLLRELSDKQKEAFAWKWWISDLQRGTESIDKFVKFIQRQKYCQSDKFVPGQYLQLMDGQEGSTNRTSHTLLPPL